MKKMFAWAFSALLLSLNCKAGETDSATADLVAQINFIDSVTTAMRYETGNIILQGGMASLKVPAGFKYLNAQQSQFVINKVWGNPPRPDVLGMLFPENGNPYAESSYAFIISFDEVGFVKDEDADEIDYKGMLKEIQESEKDINAERVKEGYDAIHLVGWAQSPFYDKNRKVLHWAKELKFGTGNDEHVLNYDVRVLGRKGVLSLNAVSSISGLPLVKEHITEVLAMPEFTAGNRYKDFDESTDNIAAYTIGGLVAGKILMKVGFWAMILKFWKLIAGGLIAALYGGRKFFNGRKKKEEVALVPANETAGNDDPAAV